MIMMKSSTIMASSKLCSILIVYTVLIFMATRARVGLCDYISHSCPIDTETPLTGRQAGHIKDLLISLSTNAAQNNPFYYATTNQTVSARSEVFFGLFLCRGDVQYSPNCSQCVASAVGDANQRCAASREAVVWRDLCMLRYSQSPVFAVLSLSPSNLSLALSGGDNQIMLTAQSLATEIAGKAAGSERGRFAVGKKLVSGSEVVYGLAQCTPDLTEKDCGRCFSEAKQQIVGRRRKILFPSCYLMYDVGLFFNAEFLPADPASSSPSPSLNSGKLKMSKTFTITFIAALLFVGLLSSSFILLRRRAKKYKALFPHEKSSLNDMTTVESLQFDFRSIQSATSNFSDENKLGKGGFGEVYKGTLHDGREIAVKRLSKHSAQGEAEFKNEVVLVAKLQHQNLARLFGFCLEREEKLLIYEYVPNKSLDSILFDTKKPCKLTWAIRCKIIEGIARGVMYLHEDSRLKIIHRDLKASNVLLDNTMNAKVSDFGMAKMFVGVDQTHGNTRRVVGTYGYMAPEYAMEGLYSIKSDVYSFGVLLLEILSGRKNSSFRISDCAPSLVAHAWQLWKENKTFDLIDSSLKDPQNESKLLRYVQIGLLCVQEDALLRPAMSSIILMLKSESQSLSQPHRPAFIARASTKTSHNNEIMAVDSCSVNGMTVSEFLPR